MCNFSREHYEERFCEISLNLDQWVQEKMLLIVISYL